jgi:mediator of RNA polymerase II transcription subunit 17
MLATEIISAALSKDAPVQAGVTMSQELRDLIGTGTIGMDKLNAPRTTDATKLGNRQAAKGWKIQGLNKSVDSILAAAERLKSEVERETIFWGQVLAVSDSGWAICRLPNDRHTLGVRFGFSECRIFLNFDVFPANSSSGTTIQESKSRGIATQ